MQKPDTQFVTWNLRTQCGEVPDTHTRVRIVADEPSYLIGEIPDQLHMNYYLVSDIFYETPLQ